MLSILHGSLISPLGYGLRRASEFVRKLLRLTLSRSEGVSGRPRHMF